MLSHSGTRLEVWGDPIAHSRSPQLHTAAYRVLGVDWTYDRRRVSTASFADELGGLTPQWRGLSLTMPLKSVAFATAATRDRRAQLTRAANTLLLDPAGNHAFNTDVGGIVRELREQGSGADGSARIVGAGATATSALVALSELGAASVEVVARRTEAVEPLSRLGDELGIRVTGTPFTGPFRPVAMTIATLPGDAVVPKPVSAALADAGGTLTDVVYGHWPTSLSSAWAESGQPASSGLGMLLHQALLQVRIFVAGDADTTLDDEAAVLAAMRLAVVGD